MDPNTNLGGGQMYNDEDNNDDEIEMQKAIELSLREGEPPGLSFSEEAISLARYPFLRDRLANEADSQVPEADRLRYQALHAPRGIRLLGILPVPGPSPQYRASLVAESLDNPRIARYSTLSYSWGPTFADGSHLTKELRCDEGVLMITETLHQALRYICEARAARGRNTDHGAFFLWIDSICINQADSRERNSQVALMGEIYAKCHDMIIWLGQLSDEAKKWLRKMEHLCYDFNEPWSSPNVVPQFHRYVEAMANEDPRRESLSRLLLRSPVELPSLWSAFLVLVRQGDVSASSSEPNQPRQSLAPRLKQLQSQRLYNGLMEREWFHRKWVVQEMAQTSSKPREFLIEDHVKSFTEMTALVHHSALEYKATPLNAQLANETLLQNLCRYRDTACTEPHDHIYALLGLSSDVSWLSVDYTQPVASLFSAVAEYYIETGEYILILTLATAMQSFLDCPSWVPDWREPWKSERSSMHRDVMTTISAPDRKLWQNKEGDSTACVITQPFDGAKTLYLEGWIISRCLADDGHDITTCKNCKVLNAAGGPTRHSKQPMRQLLPQSHDGGSSASLLSSRIAAIHMKWAEVIQQQFENTMHSDEKLFLLEDSAIGFVLLSAGDEPNFLGIRQYRLQFCFQVDEEGWLSNWCASVLGGQSKDCICLV